MNEPYVVTTRDGYCAGCGEKLWFHRRWWAHRRCSATLCRHREPFVTTRDPLNPWSSGEIWELADRLDNPEDT